MSRWGKSVKQKIRKAVRNYTLPTCQQIEKIAERVEKLENMQWKNPNPSRQTATETMIDPPEPPLNARVAKALGYMVSFDKLEKMWRFKSLTHAEAWPWPIVPRYSEDIELAMGALDEYCKKNDLMFRLERTPTGQGCMGFIRILGGQDIVERSKDIPLHFLEGKSFAEQICNAIVVHHERMKR